MGRRNGPLLLVLPRPLPAISALVAVTLLHPSPNFEGSESPTRASDARNLGYKGSRGWAGEPRTSAPWSDEGHWLGGSRGQRAGCRPPAGGGAGRGARRGRGAGQLLPRRLPRRRSAAYFAHEFRGRGSVAGGRAAATGARRGWSRSAPGSGRSERERGGRGLR